MQVSTKIDLNSPTPSTMHQLQTETDSALSDISVINSIMLPKLIYSQPPLIYLQHVCMAGTCTGVRKGGGSSSWNLKIFRSPIIIACTGVF